MVDRDLSCFFNSDSSKYLDRSPAFLTSDDFVRSNEIVGTKGMMY